MTVKQKFASFILLGLFCRLCGASEESGGQRHGTMELQGTGEVPTDELRADIAGTGQFSDEVCACV